MKMYVFEMHIVEENLGIFTIDISYEGEKTQILFSPSLKSLEFLKDNNVTKVLKQNEYQFRKILHNKRKDTFYKGFNLVFSMRDRKDVEAFNDRSKLVVLDKRNGKNESYVKEKTDRSINKMYIDASFLEKRGMGGFVVLHKDLEDKYHLHLEKSNEKSSNLLELLAAIRGVQILQSYDEIRIITDSQYVRKGLTEWIMNWKLNDWNTVNGEKAKNIEWWKKFDKITNNKYIEFEWVKGHSNHFENTICDLYAKEIAGSY